MTAIDAITLKSRIAAELADVNDGRVLDLIRSLLVEPKPVLRDWDYGEPGERFTCWTVLEDLAESTAIAFCEQGFGPSNPWGLVFLEKDDTGGIGMDSGWYRSFLDAFYESFSATRLAIWRIVKTLGGEQRSVITGDLSWRDAWTEIERLRLEDPTSRYDCDPHGVAR